MPEHLYVHGDTDVGQQRSQNEDSFEVARRPDGVWVLVVCDGMGGHEAGDVASRVAARRIRDSLEQSDSGSVPRRLYDALVAANNDVVAEAEKRDQPSMGTTAVAAWIDGDKCWVGWVGDSRFYLFRRGVVVDASVDHTRVQELLDMDLITTEQAKNHPDAHVLSQALGGGPAAQEGFKPSVWEEPVHVRHGDVLLLCSDGLYDHFDHGREIYGLVQGTDYRTAVDVLVQTANQMGGHDNITVVIGVVGQPKVRFTSAPTLMDTVEGPAMVPPPPGSAPAPAPATAKASSSMLPVIVGFVGLLVGVVLGGIGGFLVAQSMAAKLVADDGSGPDQVVNVAPEPALDAPTPQSDPETTDAIEDTDVDADGAQDAGAELPLDAEAPEPATP